VLPGYRYFFARLSDGTVRVWGGQSNAAATMKRYEVPTLVAGWEHVRRLEAAGLCAVGSDGSIDCVEGAPSLPQQAVARKAACASRAAGYATCDAPRSFGVAASYFFRGGVCAVHESGERTCLDEDLVPRPTPYAAEVIEQREPCERRLGGEVRCGGRAIVGLGSVQALAADAHACGIRTNGTVACWQVFGHYATEGGLGAAHDVEGVERATAVGVALRQGCAVGGGDLFCWSLRGYYDNRPTSYDGPVRLLAGVDELAMGALYGCAKTKDGRVACWGNGDKGQLGTGDRRSRDEARPIEGLDHVAHVSAGGDEACALREDGAVLCWGSNLYGTIVPRRPGTPLIVAAPKRVEGLP